MKWSVILKAIPYLHVMDPEVALMRPVNVLSKVVFPAPDAPRMAITSPGFATPLIPCKIC